MDYHVFVLSRVRELALSGVPVREAVRRGVSESAGTTILVLLGDRAWPQHQRTSSRSDAIASVRDDVPRLTLATCGPAAAIDAPRGPVD